MQGKKEKGERQKVQRKVCEDYYGIMLKMMFKGKM